MSGGWPAQSNLAGVTASFPNERIHNRSGGTPANTIAGLGLLAEFVGTWFGQGLNLAARPAFQGTPPFFLELRATSERLAITALSAAIPNEGSLQPDISLHGVRYLHEVTDFDSNAGIHVEPGLWLHVPDTTFPAVSENYVRQAAMPQGISLLAQSSFFTTVSGGPLINPVNAMPFTDTVIPGLNSNPTQPVTDPLYLAQYTNSKLPAFGLLNGLNAAATIKDPTELLRAQIKNQNIIETIVISISTAAPGALVNIPFVQTNAKATQLDAIFWVETVKLPNGEVFLQMQYVQRVILNFIGINWPHISVATLRSI
jgi:hypothetical protein